MTIDKGLMLDTLPGYRVAQVYRLLRHAMDDALREVGLTTPQWAALCCMVQHEEVSGAEMARMHHVTPQTMNTILQNLENNGMIVREPHPRHGTVLRVHLTDEAGERLEDVVRRVEAVQENMLRALSVPEREILMELLGRCMASLEAGDPTGGHAPGCVD